jgi:mannose-1-phosphate guanylyltransferase
MISFKNTHAWYFVVLALMEPVAVVMAGGLGTRLWPRSTERRPKQFVHVLGDGTLIQNTVMRLLPVFPPERIFVVTTKDLAEHIPDQLPVIPAANVIVEPFGRNTAPCMALSATVLRHRFGDDCVMIALPSDHVISNVPEFHLSLERAVHAAEDIGGIVTIGVMPTRPETGFGYIQVGDEVSCDRDSLNGVVKRVTTFAEKPEVHTAQRFMDAGDFVWNSGIFIGRIGDVVRSIAEHLPDHAPLFQLLERHIDRDTYADTLETIYRQMRSVSYDIGVMEEAGNVLVVEGTFGWSDVGTWDELYRLSMKDGRNNVIEGNVVTMNTTNTLVSAAGGKMIGLVGIDNLIVVETESTIMICKRGEAEHVRDLVDLLRRRQNTRNL